MKRQIELYQFERDAIAKEKETRLREKFHEAHQTGHSFLAWKLARTHLAGKGGGVKTSSTTCLDRRAWEAHFSSLLHGSRVDDLDKYRRGSNIRRLP
jgi:hypothetical protein